MRFFLGVHQPEWMSRTGAPLFVSAVRLRKRRQLPRAAGPWALDSGGFSELSLHGRWTISPGQYADEAQRWRDEIGGMEWAAIMDWMCEETIREKTGLTVAEHQERTVQSLLDLRSLATSVPWVPVVQGWTVDDYHRCVDLYATAGVDLTREPLVGVGSVCRRQGSAEAGVIVRSLCARGLRLHGFGMKTIGLVGICKLARYLVSSDSMAWSLRGRNVWHHEKRRACGGEHRGGCGNCLTWALKWRGKLVSRVERVTRHGTQQLLW